MGTAFFSLVTYVIDLHIDYVDFDGSMSYSLWFTQLVQLGLGVVAVYGDVGFSVGIPHSMTVILA